MSSCVLADTTGAAHTLIWMSMDEIVHRKLIVQVNECIHTDVWMYGWMHGRMLCYSVSVYACCVTSSFLWRLLSCVL